MEVKTRSVRVARTFAIVGVVMAADSVLAEPDWGNLPVTEHSVFQVVDGDGNGTYPVGTSGPIKMIGVLLNNPEDMLDATPGAPGFLGGQWQAFVQTVDPTDFAGTALFMGQYIGRPNGFFDPAHNYSDSQWQAELRRLNRDPATHHLFRAGDLIEVDARAPGLFHNGKTNVNEGHSNNPAADFDLHLLQAGYGLPSPIALTISDLKTVADECIFDPTRALGGEHYQGSRVKLIGVHFTSTAGFAQNATMTVTDTSGRTLPVLIGLNHTFSASYRVPTGTMDIDGILDQEDATGDDGFKDGYRLWVMKAWDIHVYGDADDDGVADDLDSCPNTIPGVWVDPAGCPASIFGDFDRDGDVDETDLATFRGCGSRAEVPHNGTVICQWADSDHDDDVDMDDFGVVQRCHSGEDRPGNPGCSN